jgi:beta-phosphoglucomutase
MYKKIIEGIKVVAFDLDGTIVDTEYYAVLAFEKILQQNNPDLFVTDVYGLVGETLSDKWQRIKDDGKLPKGADVKQLTQATHNELLALYKDAQFQPKPGFWSLAYKLKEDMGLKIALTTNSIRRVAETVENKLGIQDIFDFKIYGDDVRNKKPDPEIYFKTARNFKIAPTEMLVFEDSIYGAQAADKSGARLIVIWDEQTSETLFPENRIMLLTDFEGLAESLEMTAEEYLKALKEQRPDLMQRPQTQTQSRS